LLPNEANVQSRIALNLLNR